MAGSASASAAGVGGIETRSIDYVPESERHGKVWQQGPFWFLGNFQFFTIFLGFTGPAFGLSMVQTIVAGTLGIAFGTLFMAFHATQGPHLGLPQMIQSRAQLGYRGVIVALFGSFVTFMLFNVVDVILLSGGLNGIFGWDLTVIAIGTTVIAAALAIYGHDLLHRVFRALLYISLPLMLILTVAIVTGGVSGSPAPAGEFTIAAFVAQFMAAAAYNITYAPYVSDYSRYMPRSTKTGPIVWSVFLGAAGSAVWLIAIGAWLATNLAAVDPLVSLRDAGDLLFGGFGSALAIMSVLALVATMGINAYSAMLSTVTAIDSLRPIKPTRTLRIATITVLAVAWVLVAINFPGDAIGALFSSLVVMLYLLVPWTAINLVDYFFVRRGRYAILDLFTPSGIYGSWGRRGLISYFVGLASMIPFVYIPAGFTDEPIVGPIATQLGGTDISAVVGLVVSALVYFALTRSLDVAGEGPAIDASERTIAETMP
ncbi:MAG: allantoin permease [Chloroflexi bacterium]|nr:allantoin permease [Chloroflexota bacterium]